MKIIEQEWLEFKKSIISKNLPKEQIDSLKKAFYGGVLVMILNLEETTKYSSQDRIRLFRSIEKELYEFRWGLAFTKSLTE